MKTPLREIWKMAIYETLRRLFGHEYGCCEKWWRKCSKCIGKEW
jgi:hypothetical protein